MSHLEYYKRILNDMNKEDLIKCIKKDKQQNYIGTSGYTYPFWQSTNDSKSFFPVKLAKTKWFQYYSENFNSLEINATFYRQQSEKTWQKWYDEAPEGFQYSIKMHKFFTHNKKLSEPQHCWDTFWNNRCKRLKEKLGVVLFQFASNFKNTPIMRKRLIELEHVLPKDVKFAFEFRDKSWWSDEIYDILKRNNWCMVTIFLNNSQEQIYKYKGELTKAPQRTKGKWTPWAGNLEGPIVLSPITADFNYIRCHGGYGQYMGNHMNDYQTIMKLMDSSFTNYVYFNNTDSSAGYPDDIFDVIKQYILLGYKFDPRNPILTQYLTDERKMPAAIYDALMIKRFNYI